MFDTFKKFFFWFVLSEICMAVGTPNYCVMVCYFAEALTIAEHIIKNEEE